MIKRSGVALCGLDHRQGARVSWFGLKTKVDGFSQFGLKTGGYGFPDMSLKIGNYSLVIWASKLPQWFPGLGPKAKWSMICRLCHKTHDRMKTVRNMRQDLVSCFIWKQVRLGFPVWPQDWRSHDTEGACGIITEVTWR
jgi:hypothetical protein